MTAPEPSAPMPSPNRYPSNSIRDQEAQDEALARRLQAEDDAASAVVNRPHVPLRSNSRSRPQQSYPSIDSYPSIEVVATPVFAETVNDAQVAQNLEQEMRDQRLAAELQAKEQDRYNQRMSATRRQTAPGSGVAGAAVPPRRGRW